MRIPSAQGWVLYDGDCVFCVQRLGFWSPVLRRRGFEADTLQAECRAQDRVGVALRSLFGLPGFNLLIGAGYKRLAANRHCVSGYCARRT
jgi:hypothetical protein